jgi:hypothetical protein
VLNGPFRSQREQFHIAVWRADNWFAVSWALIATEADCREQQETKTQFESVWGGHGITCLPEEVWKSNDHQKTTTG